ncbi:MAG: CotH kinase family protein [Rikenellaceae bacterium]|nr:CotH kinase family protein [Rikenellaceae bacterium]
MKQYLQMLNRLTATLLFCVGIASCTTPPPAVEKQTVTLSTQTLDFDWTYCEQAFEVTSEVAFTITADVNWLSFDETIFPAGSHIVTVAAEQNNLDDTREATIFVMPYEEEALEISVWQIPNGWDEVFEVPNKNLEADSRQQTIYISVNSGKEFSAVAAADWLSVPEEKFDAGKNVQVPVTLERNLTNQRRVAKVSVHTEYGNWIDVTIVQDEYLPMLSVATDTLTIDGNHGQLTFEVNCDEAFTIDTEVDWITPDKETYEAGQAQKVTLNITRNMNDFERKSTIVVNGGSQRLTHSIVVIQGPNIPAVDNTISKISLLKKLNPTLDKDYIMTPDENGVFSCYIPAQKEDDYVFISGKDVRYDRISLFDIENVVVTFESNAERVYVNNQPLVSGQSKCDLSTNTTFKAVAESGDIRNYTVDLTYFTGLPIICIDLDSNGEVSSRDNYEYGTVRIIGADDIPGLPEQRFEIHGRGNSSWGTFRKKPSYTFKLDKAQEVGGMPAHKKWVMIGNYRDKTLLRNQVAWWCSERLPALKWTPRYRQMELILNGMHRGVYQVTEQVRIGENRVNIAEMLPTDTEGDAITGGYIVEFHYGGDADQWGWDMPFMRGGSGAAVKVPKIEDSNTAQRDYIMNYVMTIDNWFASGENLDELMETYIDMPSWVAQWLVFEISGTTEPQGPNSWYTYKQRGDDKWYCGPAWDFDYRSYLPSTGNHWVNAAVMYMPEMLRYRPFKDELVRQWRTYLEPVLPDLLEYIEEQREYLRMSEDANWSIHDQNLIDDGRHENGDENIPWEDAIDRMILYLNTKWPYISKSITNM